MSNDGDEEESPGQWAQMGFRQSHATKHPLVGGEPHLSLSHPVCLDPIQLLLPGQPLPTPAGLGSTPLSKCSSAKQGKEALQTALV